MDHPLLAAPAVGCIEAAVSRHAGRPWRLSSWTDLSARSSHPAVVASDGRLGVFVKLAAAAEAAAQVDAELAGLQLLAAAGVSTPVPVGSGRLDLPDGSSALVVEALDERVDRDGEDWQAIGRTLATIHDHRGSCYGATSDGFFGPLHQANAPVDPDTWVEFYATRRVRPWLSAARATGSVDTATAARIEMLLGRLPELSGPDPGPSLLHGDAQHHNFVSTATGAVVIDPSPYFGHPEVDLALLDYFSPVPPATWSAYAEVRPIDPGFTERRELWRVFAYLGVLSVDAVSPVGRAFSVRLHAALDRYG
jgi:fructosamine-3-kinase